MQETDIFKMIPDIWSKELKQHLQKQSVEFVKFYLRAHTLQNPPTLAPPTFHEKTKIKIHELIASPLIWADNFIHHLADRFDVFLPSDYSNDDW